MQRLGEEDTNVLVETNIIPKAKMEANFDGDLQKASEGQLRSILDCVARLLKVHARRQQNKAKLKLKRRGSSTIVISQTMVKSV